MSPTQKGKEKIRASLKEHITTKTKKFPKGLVGSKSTANIKVNGVDCNSLLDTGSQVTTVSQSFYDMYLSDHAIQPVSDILEVEGANGQCVPYTGYVQITIKFPKEFIPSEPEIQTLALIVSDVRSNSSIPILIGTNTLDPLYEQVCDNISWRPNFYCGYLQVLKTLQLRHRQSSGRLGLVKLNSCNPDVIPAGQRVVLEGSVNVGAMNNEKWALLEQPSVSSLPGGVFIDCCLITIPTCLPYKVPVVLRNETSHDVVLPRNCVIAELSVPYKITPTQKTTTNQLQETSPSCQPETASCSSPQSEASSQCQQFDKGSELKFDFGDSPLSEEWKNRITQRLNAYSDVFSHHDLDFGHATKTKHSIKLKDETPFKHRPRPIHPQDYDAVRRHLQTLLDAGIIRESESPFSSPIVIVRKKNGDVRLCVDYRRLNMQTIKDAYALPNLEESFSAMNGSQWFSVMDLKSGYYQIEMEESDKPKTAFVCPLGFWEWNRMPQGITNAPSTFQRLMEKCMGDMHLREVLVFIDDLIVFSKTLEEHEVRLTNVLDRLRDNGLKLSPEKCRFAQTSVRYLGHIVSRNGVETDPQKIEALKTWPRPQTLKELKSFLGFSGYYRRFVQDYSKIVKPLTKLTAGYPPNRKGARVNKTDMYYNPKDPFGERWTPVCQESFEKIIEKLTSSPVLGFANPKLPYILHTDASTTGLGAALYQEHDGQSRVIAYASRGLSHSEARYPAHKLEFLALKWAVTEKFHDYLYGNTFTVVTDNNPLRYILTTAKLDATGYRWLAALSTFTFDIKYRAGKQNQDADGLSRRPHGQLTSDSQSQEESLRIREFTSYHLAPAEVVKVTCQYHTVAQDELSPAPCLIESLAVHPDAVPAGFEKEGSSNGLSTIPKYSSTELAKLQRADPEISAVIKLIEAGESKSTSSKQEPIGLRLMLKEMSRFELKNGLLYRKRQCNDQLMYQLVLPQVLRQSVLTSLHDEMGHMGMERTLELARLRFYWPKLASDVELKVKGCARCVKRKSQPEKAAPLVSIHTSRPMELVCMDFLSLEPDSHNTKDILVITDHFTKYAVAIPTKDQKATTVARCLWEQFLVHYGFPERLHSDQGRDFESQIIKELCSLVGIRKIRTSPYHPRGNPVERYNRTLLSMLGTLKEQEKTKWREYVKPLTHAYNCTKNEVTGFTPYELMFGRQPRLPIDIAFGLPVNESSVIPHSQYVKRLKSYLTESYQLAAANAKKVADKNKRRFDMRVRESTLEIGDRVLVRNLRLRGKHKLADRWESTVYIVQKRAGDLPVYTVCPEGQEGPVRTLHRDLLLSIGFLSEVEEEPVKTSPPRKPRTRQQCHTQLDENPLYSDDEDTDDPLFYPMKIIETKTKVLEPFSVVPKQGFATTISGADTQTDLSHEEQDQTKKKERGEITVNLSESLMANMSNSPREEISNTINNLLDTDLNNFERAENYPLREESNYDLMPINGTEKDITEMERQNKTDQPMANTVRDVPVASLSGKGKDEPQMEEEERQLESSSILWSDDIIAAGAGEIESMQEDQTERENHFLPSLSPFVNDSREDGSQPTRASGHVDVERSDSSNMETPSVTLRRSERLRKAPGKFTYSQLGNPLISFAQTILDGFNRALVETFDSQCPYERKTLAAIPIEGQIGSGEKMSPTQKGKEKIRASLKEHITTQTKKFPKGLVGSKSTANIKVNGVDCNSLLDTGSQVTTVSQSFYDMYLSDHAIQPVSDILEVEGANGQCVPYTGYVQITIKFPKEFIPSEPEIQTLALIVSDVRSNSSIPILIGTNTLDPLYEQVCDNISWRPNFYCGYLQVLKTLQLRHRQSSGRLGLVKLNSCNPDVIPAGQRVVLEGSVNVGAMNNEKWALLEQPSVSSLPGGVFIDCCLITIPTCLPYKVPVVLRNETSHDVVLPRNCVIAELSVPYKITPTQKTTTNQLQETSPSCQPETASCSSPQSEASSQCQQFDKGSELKFDFGDSPLSEEWKNRITQRLNAYSDVFSHHDLDFGHATKTKHSIKLKDETPFKHRPRPIHPQDYDAVRRHLQTLLDAGIIRESESPFSSPIVIVRKKNGDVRLCVDYRRLNMQTIKDAYALPNLEESFSAMNGSQWFSVMDLKSGYYQIEMEESDKPKTAFVCPLGFWEWNRMPQGITNAPSTFQRLMEKCMGDMHLREVLVFIDDLIVFSKTLEEHEVRLTNVLDRLRDNGLKLSPEKCRFAQTSVRYLGHIVSRNGVETDPQKIEALKTWPRPQTLKELKSFLGFSGYYRRFVQDYSKIVKPLTKLTAGYPPNRKGARVNKTDMYYNPKDPFGERWTPVCQESFEKIIEKLTSSPVLGFANPKLPYILHTDASTTGLGAALYQEHDGQSRVIAYASRGLSHSEARYPAHKLEFLALKWAVTEKFHDYLYGNTFTVVTDNNPLRYILTTAKLDATGYRWLAALSTFTFDIKYRAGKQNQDADGLSRRPHGQLTSDSQSQEESLRIREFTSYHLAPAEVVKVTCQYHTVAQDELSPAPCLIESLAVHPDAVPAVFEKEGSSNGLSTIPKYSSTELAKLQRADPEISAVIKLIEAGESKSTSSKQEPIGLRLMLKEMSRFELKNGLLYRKRQCNDQLMYQLVLPQVLRQSVLTSLHDEMGHMGMERTLELARLRFYWPKLASDVELKVKGCARCVKRKSQPEKAAPLVSIHTSRPMELVCMDFLSLEPDSHNTKDILVITDHFTKYAVAIPTKDQKATTVARCLWEQFLVHYGFPERLHSDQGRDFESQIIKELCSLVGIRKIRTSPYHPRGNPVERYNRTLLSMLGTLKEQEKTKWREYVKPLTHAYNCTKNEVTGFTPYELMFGRQPRLPIDIAFGLPVNESSVIPHSQYVKRLKSYLTESYQLAAANAKKVADKNKRRFDMRVRESTLEIGDRVLVRNLRLRGKHKLADRWESTVYIVQKRAGDLPVYTVCPEGQEGPVRTLHRDLLLSIGFLSEVEEEPVKTSPPRKPRTRQQCHTQLDENPLYSDDEDTDDPLFYPMKIIETKTKVLEPFSVVPKQGFATTISGADTQTDLSHEEQDQTKKKERGEITVNLSESLMANMSNSPREEISNTINNLLDTDLNNFERAENYPLREESNYDLMPINGTEKDITEMERQNKTDQPMANTVRDVPVASLSGKGKDEPQMEEEERQLESSSILWSDDIIAAGAGEIESMQEDQTERENHFLPSLSPFVNDSREDGSQPTRASGHVDVERSDSSNMETPSVTLRRSERLRKAPGKFTYSQLGNPLISFAQTILDGFNRALVETFDSQCPYERKT
ncbi:uncharacterized protein [Channa argus]|uniref:uncharacterized protein n=1 Tax=Channa argus TaxID=215402 RepID=UPI003522E12F